MNFLPAIQDPPTIDLSYQQVLVKSFHQQLQKLPAWHLPWHIRTLRIGVSGRVLLSLEPTLLGKPNPQPIVDAIHHAPPVLLQPERC
jgi:hypothetical protein